MSDLMLLLAILFLGLFWIVARWLTNRYRDSHPVSEVEPPSDNSTAAPSPVSKSSSSASSSEVCAEGGCGMQVVCNKSVSDARIIYFEDEELDLFRDRQSDSYSDSEVAQFSEVLHTLQPQEVSAWLNSLCARKVQLPVSLRTQAIALANKGTQS